MNSIKLCVMAQVLPFLLIAPGVVLAQTAPTRSEAAGAMKAGPQKAATQPGAMQYSRQQIDQMIAPIALYPDQLLAQVLMAATYSQQLVEAATWLDDPAHAQLQGDALMAALQPLEWHPSVKALMAFPQVIVLMTEHIEWTEALGVAFATQQAQVMNRVQALRQLAVKSGKIDKVKQVSVRREGPSIVIVSAQPDRVFVPVYNPSVVYGTWPDREFPPVYLPPPRRFAESRGFVVETVESGFEVIGVPVVRQLWGWTRPDWRSERISINTVEYARITRTVRPPQGNFWRHEGPVMLVGRAPRPAGPSAVAMPAGTVAPVAAAAVVALPQRARAQPNVIQLQTPAAAAAPSATPPASAPAATAQPSTAQPSTTTAQPGAPPASTTTAQPGTTPPAQTPSAAAKPSTTESAAKPATNSPKPGTAEAEKDRKPAAHTGTAKPGDTHAATPPAATSPKPGTAEAEKDRKPAVHTGPGKPSDTQAATPPAAVKPAEPSATQADKAKPAGAPAHEPQTGKKEVGKKEPATTPAAKAEPPAAAPAAAPTKERGQAAGAKPAEPVAKAAPEQAGAKPAAVPPPPAQERAAAPPPRAPEQATAKPPAPAQTGAAAPPGHGGQRPPAAEPAQGSSSRPAKPGPAGPGQRPHEAGNAPAPGQPDAADKKER